MEYLIWENKVIETIKKASEEELLYYAVLMFLDIKDQAIAEIPKPQSNNKEADLKQAGQHQEIGKSESVQLPEGKRGRKPTKIYGAKYYLNKFQSPENKNKFLDFLKIEYKNVKPKEFNQLIKVLFDGGFLKPAENKEYKEAFEKALGRIPQSKQNFNKQFRADPDEKIYKLIKQAIDKKIYDDGLV